MDYNRFFNRGTLLMKTTPIEALQAIANKNPDIISLAQGSPNPDVFPFVEANFTLKDGSQLRFNPTDMKRMLQYHQSQGSPELLAWTKELMNRIHKPPLFSAVGNPGQTDCVIVTGSMEGISQALHSLVDEGDNVLVEQPTFSTPAVVFESLLSNLIPVESDVDGLRPDHLRQVLSKWKPSDAKDSKSGLPKVLYCIPSAGNPTGYQLTLERKKEIYKIAQEYDLIILEDDAYYFVQFCEKLPTFLSMDVDGRVLRFDTFSKVVSGGMRVGVVTGPSKILEKIVDRLRASSLHPSGISQMLLYKFFSKLGYDGFTKHMDKQADVYRTKRDVCLAAANKHLSGLAEWTVPSGGMFLWLQLRDYPDSYEVCLKAIEEDVLFVPGNALNLARADEKCPYLRLSYANVTEENLNKALSKLAQILKTRMK